MISNATFLELALPAVPASVREARVSVAGTVTDLGASERVVDDVRLCVSEAVSNVVQHAYGTKRGEVALLIERGDGQIEVVVRDAGLGMGQRSSGEKTSGGFGLKIIDKLAERVTITTTREAGTEIRMEFPLVGEAPGETQPGETPPA